MSADLKLSTFAAAASNVLTTGLNSLGSSTGKAVSSAIDNSSDLELFDLLELTVTFGSAPTAGGLVEVYLLPSIDGSNYADGDASTEAQPALLVATFSVKASTSAQRLLWDGVRLPAGLFKYLVKNTTSQAFPASGSVLKRRPWHYKSV